MFYDGPTSTDYVNIHAMNRAFLKLLRLRPERFGLDARQAIRLSGLGRQQMERLAATPFLLFTIQEKDELKWRGFCNAEPNADLFEQDCTQDADVSNLLATTTGFLWQLAQQNRYSVRMICGATQRWCEMITSVTYFELVTRIRNRGDLLASRQAANADIWSKLLVEGVAAERRVRDAAHIAVLQTLLTGHPGVSETGWPIAACKTSPPQLRVADESGKA